jgi:hypothetical protein
MKTLDLNQLGFEELSVSEYTTTEGGGWVDVAVGIFIDNVDSFISGVQAGFEANK